MSVRKYCILVVRGERWGEVRWGTSERESEAVVVSERPPPTQRTPGYGVEQLLQFLSDPQRPVRVLDHPFLPLDCLLRPHPRGGDHWQLQRPLDSSRFAGLFPISLTNGKQWFSSAHKEMWTVTNYFLLSLTLSDLLISTLNCIPSFIFMRDQ